MNRWLIITVIILSGLLTLTKGYGFLVAFPAFLISAPILGYMHEDFRNVKSKIKINSLDNFLITLQLVFFLAFFISIVGGGATGPPLVFGVIHSYSSSLYTATSDVALLAGWGFIISSFAVAYETYRLKRLLPGLKHNSTLFWTVFIILGTIAIYNMGTEVYSHFRPTYYCNGKRVTHNQACF